MAGRLPLPQPWSGMPNGGVGPLIASTSGSNCWRKPFPAACVLPTWSRRKKPSTDPQVTSVSPIKNGENGHFFWGLRRPLRNGSSSGLPIAKVPPGIAFMSNDTVVPGMVSVKFSNAVTVAASVNGSPFFRFGLRDVLHFRMRIVRIVMAYVQMAADTLQVEFLFRFLRSRDGR